ncbi:MAG: CcmD family protein [Schleiferiaceae bacterium]|nr:CcmD family protein [Schleiferiaceae bacterium]
MKKFLPLLAMCLPYVGLAQNDNPMYGNGKIYVVVAVIAIIFVGLALYLVQLDRKITKLENEK